MFIQDHAASKIQIWNLILGLSTLESSTSYSLCPDVTKDLVQKFFLLLYSWQLTMH
jgi:hypothetical protein